jgi:hypothetical protein
MLTKELKEVLLNLVIQGAEYLSIVSSLKVLEGGIDTEALVRLGNEKTKEMVTKIKDDLNFYVGLVIGCTECFEEVCKQNGLDAEETIVELRKEIDGDDEPDVGYH